MNPMFQHTVRVPHGPAIIVALKDDLTKTPARNRVAVELFAALLEMHLAADGFSAGQVTGHGYWDSAAFVAPVHGHCVASARATVEKMVARHMTGKAWVAMTTENGVEAPLDWTPDYIAEFAVALGQAMASSVDNQLAMDQRLTEIGRRIDELSAEVNRGEEWRNPPPPPTPPKQDDDEEGGDK